MSIIFSAWNVGFGTLTHTAKRKNPHMNAVKKKILTSGMRTRTAVEKSAPTARAIIKLSNRGKRLERWMGMQMKPVNAQKLVTVTAKTE